MARRPANYQWLGHSDDLVRDLNLLDRVGNKGMGRRGLLHEKVASLASM